MAGTKIVNGVRVKMSADDVVEFNKPKPLRQKVWSPDLNAAIQALIDGDTVAAQAALDRKI